jgi:DNA-binding NarL/FixJ family response regulator
MADVLVIEKSNQITSELSAVQANVQTVNDEVKALNIIEQTAPSVVLLQYSVRNEQTTDYIKLIQQASSNSSVVVIADELSEKEVLNCLLAGANGYQQLNELSDYAIRLVTAMDAGEAWITRRMTATLLTSLRMQ